jgi:hypothetical protein
MNAVIRILKKYFTLNGIINTEVEKLLSYEFKVKLKSNKELTKKEIDEFINVEIENAKAIFFSELSKNRTRKILFYSSSLFILIIRYFLIACSPIPILFWLGVIKG